MTNVFITGIGTDVGKTLVSAIFTEAWQADYWKPVQSGTIESTDAGTVRSLVSNDKTVFHKEVYSLKAPVSPHLAAHLEGIAIDLDKIVLPQTNNTLIIEGAGGLLVPLNHTHYAIDLADRFGAEVILVVRYYLGCINHTLLSLSYLAQHGYKIHGLVLNGTFDPAVKESIVNYTNAPVLLEIPELPIVNKGIVLQYAQQLKRH